MKIKVAISFFLALLPIHSAICSDNISSVLKDGLSLINGKIRMHYVTRQFDTKADQHIFSPGGNIRLETPSFYGFQAGVGYYWQHDFGLNSDKAERRISPIFTGEDVDILGEAFLRAVGFKTAVTVGRHMVNTPFANPADAFLIPTLFEGISFNNQTIPYLSLSAHYLTKIKDRPSNEFVNVGEFSANRLGIPSEKTKGTIIGNATYTIGTLSLEGWFYQFTDLFNMGLVQANYDFPEIHGLRIYLGAQGVLQKDEGRRLLGVVDTLGYGLKIGAVKGPAELILSYNGVSDRPDAFRNGAILAPYSFSNTTLFTNNIVSSLENSDSGDVYKALLSYRVAPNLTFLVSHAVFKFNNKADVSETDIDWRYGLDRIAKGLSFRNRIGIITSDTKGSDMLDIRVQFEYVF